MKVRAAGGKFGAVLLDLDGCLLDSNDAHARAWSDALALFGHRVGAQRIRRHIGKGGSELLRDFVAPGEQHLLSDAIGETQTRVFLKRFGRVRAIPGAAAAVRGMRGAHLPVVLASSADRRVVDRALAKLRLTDVLTGAICSDDVEKAKPFHDVFSVAIARYRLSGRRPVAIGDTPYDVAAAHQIGVPCVALASGGFSPRSLASADLHATDLLSLEEGPGPLPMKELEILGVHGLDLRSDDPEALARRWTTLLRVPVLRRTSREIVLARGPEFFVRIRRATRGARTRVTDVHIAIKRERHRKDSKLDDLGGDSRTQRLPGGLGLVLREFRGAPRSFWRAKR